MKLNQNLRNFSNFMSDCVLILSFDAGWRAVGPVTGTSTAETDLHAGWTIAD